MHKVNTTKMAELTWSSPKGKFCGAGKEISEALGRKPKSTDLNERHPFDLACYFSLSSKAETQSTLNPALMILASTASSVIAVMPACMLAVPNPGSRNEWPVHGEGGMHDVWPFKFETEFLNVIVLAIASHSPHKYSKTAKQHY